MEAPRVNLNAAIISNAALINAGFILNQLNQTLRQWEVHKVVDFTKGHYFVFRNRVHNNPPFGPISLRRRSRLWF
jgi:hypothetical protein